MVVVVVVVVVVVARDGDRYHREFFKSRECTWVCICEVMSQAISKWWERAIKVKGLLMTPYDLAVYVHWLGQLCCTRFTNDAVGNTIY